MKADLVCEGGGVRGIALLGAISCLEDYGYKFQKYAGTSAGAMVAALSAVGYTGKELKEVLFDIKFSDFADKNKFGLIPIIGASMNLFKEKGIFSGNSIEAFLNKMFKAKGKVKFKDIAVNGESPLKLIATDITNRDLLVLPDDLVKYNLDPLNLKIARAVRMSISIPFYFNPVILKNGNNSSFIVDGGLLSNFPVWIFDVKNKPRWPTFGLRLVSDKNLIKVNANKSSLLNFTSDVIETMLSKDDEAFLNNKDAIRTINIRTYNIETVQFDLSKEQMNMLYDSGYNCAKKFLLKWNFNSYISRYRN